MPNFAYRTAAGGWAEIPPFGPVTTELRLIEDEAEAEHYDAAVGEVIEREAHLRGEEAADLPEPVRARHRILEIVEPPPPEADQVVVEATLVDVDGLPVRQLTTRAYTAEEVAQFQATAIAAVKAEARRRILTAFPDWRQANMTAQGVELLSIRQGRAWTAGEQAVVDALSAAWGWIKAVRTASNTIELDLPEDAAGLKAFDAAEHSGWPAEAAPSAP